METQTQTQKPRLGLAMCGSFCTLASVIALLPDLVKEYTVIPVFSETMRRTDTRFGRADDLTGRIEAITGNRPITSLVEAETVGPRKLFDILAIAPCTGNTLSKLAHGITDNTVTMTAKAHVRNGRPLVLAVASNDALAAGLGNFGVMANKKGVYFVPLRQDDPVKKPFSLIADFTCLPRTLEEALQGRQYQPVLLPPPDFGKDASV